MKKYAQFFIAIASAFSLNAFAQSGQDLMASNDLAVVSYHVEERINKNFGGRITTYNVPSLNLVSTKELGENNVRIITPKYAKVRAKIAPFTMFNNRETKGLTSIDNITVGPINTDIVKTAPRKREYVEITMVDTYERIMDKGYKSIPMITKVADKHFFDGDMTLAVKWYTELFSSTTDLAAVYYFRYAQALISTGQTAKGTEMMKIFETKSL